NEPLTRRAGLQRGLVKVLFRSQALVTCASSVSFSDGLPLRALHSRSESGSGNTGSEDQPQSASARLQPHALEPRHPRGLMALLDTLCFRMTDEDGRWAELTGSAGVTPGLYKLRFETGPYWETLGESCFYPYVEVVFRITEEDLKLHVPLLLSRFSYSTYRGS
ncbi:hypothetical protein DNTS_011853, partial [Danionella cerebrum]